MAKLTLTDLVNLNNQTSAVNTINNNNALVEAALENTLSRDGTSPNSMSADLDMNSNDILNAANINAADFMVGGQSIVNQLFDWEGAWTTSTGYVINDAVTNDGSTYICIQAHTSGASSEPGVGGSWETYWDLAASKGDTGSTGATGADGVNAGLSYTFNSGTSGDPGSGQFLFNNATISSVTAINISDTDGDSNDASGFILAWDDSTNTALRGTVAIRDRSDTSAYAIFNITGASTDNTSYVTLSVTHVASAGTLAGDCGVTFTRTGDKGADGAGSGDVIGPASATDDNFVLFDGTTGKLIKDGPAQPSGTIVGTSDSQTLTNKTVALGSNTISGTAAQFDTACTDDNFLFDGDLLDEDDFSSDSATAPASQQSIKAYVTGKQTIYIPAGAMKAATTSGAASGEIETTTNDINFDTFDFDATADEYVHFNVAFPKGWNEGTVTFRVFWTTTATDTDGVAWGLQGLSLSDNATIDTSWGTAIVVTDDAQGAAQEMLVTSESSAVTIAGTPAEGDLCFFRLFRDVSDANDDMTEDALLIGIQLFYTTDTPTDD